ncbi:MAG: NAD(P)H-hydrate dehydratase, partial [Flavobacterium sp.]
LFGNHVNDFARMVTAQQKAKEYNIILVLKSHHTLIAFPNGSKYFNSTGNAGMAKGGSGDVLTGIITSLLAQGYEPTDAALLGVYIHGWAGDVAAKKFSKEAMLPSQLIQSLSNVFLALQ